MKIDLDGGELEFLHGISKDHGIKLNLCLSRLIYLILVKLIKF